MAETIDHLRDIGLLPGGSPPAAPPARPAEPKVAEASAAQKGKAGKEKAEKGKPEKGKAESGKAEKAKPKPELPAGDVAPVEEKTEAELAKMSKDERRAYHMARRAAELQQKATGGEAGKEQAGKQPLTKAQRRAIQDAQRKAKEDLGNKSDLLNDLKLQGLTEAQAKVVIAEMEQSAGLQDDDDDEDEAPEDFHSCVAQWMKEQAAVTKDSLHEFNLQVRFQGHVEKTPPDHLKEVLAILTAQACAECDVASPKLQPMAVSKKAEPLVTKWAPLLKPLYDKIGDPFLSADVVVSAAQTGVAAAGAAPEAAPAGVVGCLMAIREIDMIEDEDLLTGCKRCEQRSKVMDKFVEFLEDALDDDSDDDED